MWAMSPNWIALCASVQTQRLVIRACCPAAASLSALCSCSSDKGLPQLFEFVTITVDHPRPADRPLSQVLGYVLAGEVCQGPCLEKAWQRGRVAVWPNHRFMHRRHSSAPFHGRVLRPTGANNDTDSRIHRVRWPACLLLRLLREAVSGLVAVIR